MGVGGLTNIDWAYIRLSKPGTLELLYKTVIHYKTLKLEPKSVAAYLKWIDYIEKPEQCFQRKTYVPHQFEQTYC